MDWWVAVLVIYLDKISGSFVALGFISLGCVGMYWIVFGFKWNQIYWSEDNWKESSRPKTEPIRYKLMKAPIKATYVFIPIAVAMFFVGSFIPSPQMIFKIVALKYGADAVTSDEAKNLGNKMYESMDKSLSLLNSKLDEWNGKKK